VGLFRRRPHTTEEIAADPETLRPIFNVGVAISSQTVEELMGSSEPGLCGEPCLFLDEQTGQPAAIGYVALTESRFLWAAAAPEKPWSGGEVPRGAISHVSAEPCDWDRFFPHGPLDENGVATLRPVGEQQFGTRPTELAVTTEVDGTPVLLRVLIDELSPLPKMLEG
jgi:hypothetical protein